MEVHSHPLPIISTAPKSLLVAGKALTGVGSQLLKIGVARGLRAVRGSLPLRLPLATFCRPSAHRRSLLRGSHRRATSGGNGISSNMARYRQASPLRRQNAGWAMLLRGFPIPVGGGPQCAIFVAAGLHEFQILRVRDFVLVDGERGDHDGVGFKLVVPAESSAARRRGPASQDPGELRPSPAGTTRLEKASGAVAGRTFCSSGRRCSM